ncbi:ATP-binding cassette domain-containing protein [Actinomarinicola tropica]|uniref:ATP-binding cassette domain-containing protein n=1 Tax=Actinomarinicola tropica TaxID=2789776 RepID=A0A5Q2RNN1_9ACTN|nr:ATP-binding cassette domain-containing protein [Actinomarinicola tropica]
MNVSAPVSDLAIECEGLSKRFVVRHRAGRLRRRRVEVAAVDDVSFTVRAGEMVGYLGPNGAGKSTTIKMLTGILTPSGGRVATLGLTPIERRTELARRIGVVFGQRTQLWWDLPLADSFELLHHVYRTERARHEANLATFVDVLDMGPFLATPVRQLSLGQRMRGELTAALLHDPALVVLDEPTIGLDVVSKQAVRDFLLALNRERGTTVLLTTHDLDDVERLCGRMMIIDHGRVIHDGAVDAFKATYGTERTVVVDLVEPGPALEVAGARVTRVDGPRQWLSFDRREVTAAQVVAAIVARTSIQDLSIEEPAIEELVRRVYTAFPAPSDG